LTSVQPSPSASPRPQVNVNTSQNIIHHLFRIFQWGLFQSGIFTPHPVKPSSSEQECKCASKYYLKESPVFQHGVEGLLLGCEASVDHELRTCHVFRLIGCEIKHSISDILWIT
jgi:hypothetical protein